MAELLYRSGRSVAAASRPAVALRGAVLLLAAALGACASSPVPSPVEPLSAAGMQAVAWHSCRARLVWPDDQNPDWVADGLLAVAVFGPAIEMAGENLTLWRFHRRAGRDAAGRRFSFIFLGNALAYEAIRQRIADHPVVAELQAIGVLESMDCSDVSYWAGAAIGATSDPSWSPEMQAAWPYYIAGVSRLWLELLRTRLGPLIDDQSVGELLEASEQAHEWITGLWRTEGRHALFHHLSGVFGYQPVLMRY